MACASAIRGPYPPATDVVGGLDEVCGSSSPRESGGQRWGDLRARTGRATHAQASDLRWRERSPCRTLHARALERWSDLPAHQTRTSISDREPAASDFASGHV
eukprot:951693-Rhodomonas_salina.1